jgi:hypothetical protein
MKNLLILFFLLVINQVTKGDIYYYEFQDKLLLIINHESFTLHKIESNNHNIEILAKGSISLQSNKMYVCHDSISNKCFAFKKLDDYSISIISTNNFGLNGTLNVSNIFNDRGRLKQKLYWKENRPEGTWIYIHPNGISTVIYKSGIKKDSIFKTFKSLNETIQEEL